MSVCVDEYNKKGIDETEEKPDLDILDRGGGRETGRDSDVDGGEDYHAGEIDSYHGFKIVLCSEMIGQLVDDVHQDGGEVGHQQDVADLSAEFYRYF